MKRILFALLATAAGLVLVLSYRTSLDPTGGVPAALASPQTSSQKSATATPAAPKQPAVRGDDDGDDDGDDGDDDDDGYAPTTTPAPTATPSPADTSVGTGSGTAAASGLKDGTYLGTAASTRYGQVQVSIAVSGGAITDVTVPVYPSTGTREQRISSDAIPQLVSETLTAQSANIDMVSGATYTIEGYLASLQSAIDQARA